MSNLWRLMQSLTIEGIESINWPAILEAEFTLEPEDFFERKSAGDAIVSISGETQFTLDGKDGKILIQSTGTAAPLHHRIEFDGGHIAIYGNIARLRVEINEIDIASVFVDWAVVCFSQLLSVQLGVYCKVRSVAGKIGGRDFSLLHVPNSYSTVVNHTEPENRASILDAAVQLIDSKSPSYPRFITCSFYYHHALRLLSPYQIRFPVYTALPEVILNLAKCIELLFPSNSRDVLKEELIKLGYSEDEVRSQLLSIIIMRNEFDVGHAISGTIEPEEIKVLRNFAIRSIENVGALLRNVAVKAKENEKLLLPLSKENRQDRKRILRRLEENLAKPSLHPQSNTQVIISA